MSFDTANLQQIFKADGCRRKGQDTIKIHLKRKGREIERCNLDCIVQDRDKWHSV